MKMDIRKILTGYWILKLSKNLQTEKQCIFPLQGQLDYRTICHHQDMTWSVLGQDLRTFLETGVFREKYIIKEIRSKQEIPWNRGVSEREREGNHVPTHTCVISMCLGNPIAFCTIRFLDISLLTYYVSPSLIVFLSVLLQWSLNHLFWFPSWSPQIFPLHRY